ncbi:MAG: TonB-dependent receptor, partial [Gemmatimonadota bacterium]
VVGTKVSLGGGTLETVRGDLRHAGVLYGGRLGYRLNGGYSSSDTWSRSRTYNDLSSLRKEYGPVSDSLAPLTRELLPLKGQTKDATTGAPLGDRDPITSVYGSGRLDYYLDDGSIITGESGFAQVENEVFVTGIGRVQVTGATRPYARLGWSAEKFNVMAYWNGRKTNDPQFSLASGAPLRETSNIFHVEGQGNATFEDGRGQFVYGASVRNTNVNTSGTLMLPVNDDRSDYSYAGFAQASYDLSDIVRLVVAGRMDFNSLITPQFSPKAALVVSPNENHSFRFTFNRAFQTPNYSEFYLRAAAGAPANFLALEAGMRASALGPALAGVPQGELFTNSAAVPVWARGNAKLDVEKTTGWEVGYRGDLSSKIWVTVDAFYNSLSNFVTDLLPGVNPAFKPWTAPAAVPAAFRGALEGAVRNALLANPASRTAGLGLTRTEDGKTGIVVTYANAGSAKMWGTNVGAGFQLADEIRADGYVSLFDYSVDTDQIAAGDKLLANTPKWRT